MLPSLGGDQTHYTVDYIYRDKKTEELKKAAGNVPHKTRNPGAVVLNQPVGCPLPQDKIQPAESLLLVLLDTSDPVLQRTITNALAWWASRRLLYGSVIVHTMSLSMAAADYPLIFHS